MYSMRVRHNSLAWFVASMSSSLDKISIDTNIVPYNSTTVSQIIRPMKTGAGRGPDTGIQVGMSIYII